MRDAPRTESTAAIMRDMSERMRETAAKLDRLADNLETRNDWDTASEALNAVTNLIPNLRLDLLAARPIREFQYRVADLEDRLSHQCADPVPEPVAVPEDEVSGVEGGKDSPYLITRRAIRERAYNPDYGDDRPCRCGHPYHRHFDGFEDNAAVGCKYCPCDDFVEASTTKEPS